MGQLSEPSPSGACTSRCEDRRVGCQTGLVDGEKVMGERRLTTKVIGCLSHGIRMRL